MQYIVTHVREEWSADRSHQHIGSVCLANGTAVLRGDVVASMARGDDWWTQGGGTFARIKPEAHCPKCPVAPYITTAPDHTTLNNLDNLPPC